MTTTPAHQDDRRALDLECPNCGAKPGSDCTTPTDDGRRRVKWLHLARTDLLAA